MAQHRFPHVGDEYVGNNAHPGHDRDVDLGVSEEPEQVLPEDGAAVLRVEDVGSEAAVRAEGEEGCGQRREGHQDQD